MTRNRFPTVYLLIFMGLCWTLPGKAYAQPVVKGLAELKNIGTIKRQVRFLQEQNPGLSFSKAQEIVHKLYAPKREPFLVPVAPTLALAVARKTAQAQVSYGDVPYLTYRQALASVPHARDVGSEFPRWLLYNQPFIVPNPETLQAIEAVCVNAAKSGIDDETYQTVARLLLLKLGMQPNGAFSQIMFRGENPRLPRAHEFHLVQELTGINLKHAQKAINLHNPNITFTLKRRNLTEIILGPDTTAQDVAQVIEALTPPGWTVRMSSHEFGIQNDQITTDTLEGKLHLHIEKIASGCETSSLDLPTDISYFIYLYAEQAVAGKTPHQIIRLYHRLFRPYMDEYMTSFAL